MILLQKSAFVCNIYNEMCKKQINKKSEFVLLNVRQLFDTQFTTDGIFCLFVPIKSQKNIIFAKYKKLSLLLYVADKQSGTSKIGIIKLQI